MALALRQAGEPVHCNGAWRRRAILVVKLVVAAGLLYWLVATGRLQVERLWELPASQDVLWLLSLTFGAQALPALRWWWLLRTQGLREPFWGVVRLTWAGYFAALVLPGAAGGDLAKSYLLVRRNPGARARAFSTVLADRYIGLYGLVCVGAIAVLWMFLLGANGPAVQVMSFAMLVLILAMTFGGLAFLSSRFRRVAFLVLPGRWREAWEESFQQYRAHVPALVGCGILSMIAGALTFAAFAVAGTLLGEALSWHSAFVAGPLVVLANCLPIAPGGIGVAEAASSELFGRLGSTTGAEMMILVRVAGAVLALPGVFAVFGMKQGQVSSVNEQSASKAMSIENGTAR